MGAVGFYIKLSFLREIYSQSVSSAKTIQTVLTEMNSTLLESVSSGKTITGISANGNSTNFSTDTSLPPTTQLQLVNELLCLCEIVTEKLTNPTQLDIFNGMRDYIIMIPTARTFDDLFE